MPPTLRRTPVRAPVYNWTGLYVGVNGGWGWGRQDPLNLISNRFDRASFDINGGMVGGTFGAQIQQGYVVLGLEGDLDWADITGSRVTTPTIAGVPHRDDVERELEDRGHWHCAGAGWCRHEQLVDLRHRRRGLYQGNSQRQHYLRRAVRDSRRAAEL